MKSYTRVVIAVVIATVLLLPLLLIADGPATVNVSYATPLPFDPGDTFLGLPDTPVTYTGYAGQLVRVNSAEDALEYTKLELAGPQATLIFDVDSWTEVAAIYTADATNSFDINNTTAGGDLRLYATEDIHFRTPIVDPAMSILRAGNVGIGTTNPLFELDVNGDIRAMGSVEAVDDLWAGDDLTICGESLLIEDVRMTQDLLVQGQVEIDTSTTGSLTQPQPLLTLDAQPSSGTGITGYGPELRFGIYGQYRGGIAQVYHDDVYPQTRFEFRAGAGYGNDTLVGVIVGPVYQTVDGGQRGHGAVDFSGSRSNNADIASGDYSVLSGGASNSAWGDFAVVGGGGMNTARGDWSTVAGGEYNDASGHFSVAAGRHNEAEGHFSEARGHSAVARRYGEEAHASGSFGIVGDAQRSTFVMRMHVVHDTDDWFPLYLDGVSELMVLRTGDVWTFEAQVVASTYSAGNIAGYTIAGVIEDDDGSTALRAANVTTLYEDNASWDVRAIGDDPSDALIIEVRDSEAGEQTVFWVATVTVTIVNI